MSAFQFLGLEGNMPRLKAKRILDEARLGKVQLNAEGWFDITFMATGDRDAAERNHNEYIKACYRAGRYAE